MRKPDKTLIFGSNAPSPVSTPQSTGPLTQRVPFSQRAPVSMGSPVSRPLEKQWFNEPPPASLPLSEDLRRPVGDDLLAERRGFVPRSPERGLAFAAVALALIGVAGAGTYFFFGLDRTAHQEETSTTTVTNADVPVTNTAPAEQPAPAPPATPADLPWQPPVVDAVKAPGLTQQPAAMATAPQAVPTERTQPAPNFNTVKPVATAKQVPANDKQIEDDERAARGFYPNYVPNPGDNTVTPPPIQRTAPDETDDNTMHNPDGEPALNQQIKQ